MNFRKKLENFFYYYKWHTVAVIFIIFIAVFSVKSFMNAKEPDFNMVYVSNNAVQPDTSEKLEKVFREKGFVTDANGDSEEKFYFEPLIVDLDSDNTDIAILQKLQVYMMSGSQSLMLVHQYVVEDYDGSFEDIGKYASDTDSVMRGSEKFVTAISVQGNKFLEGIGINTENLYVAMHRRTQKQIEKGEYKNEYKEAYKALRFILDQQ